MSKRASEGYIRCSRPLFMKCGERWEFGRPAPMPWLKTFIGSSPTTILNHLKHKAVLPRTVGPVLYIISAPEFHDASLDKLVDVLSGLSNDTVGCISAPLSSSGCSLSIGMFDSAATTFRSDIPGSQPIQVGRWAAGKARKNSSSQSAANNDWASIIASGGSWNDVWHLASTMGLGEQLPPELEEAS